MELDEKKDEEKQKEDEKLEKEKKKTDKTFKRRNISPTKAIIY